MPEWASRFRWVIGAFVLFIAFVMFWASCTTYVAPNEVAVKESRIFPPTGVQKKLKKGGHIYFLLPGQEMHRFRTDVQQLEFDRSDEPGQFENRRVFKDVEINTSDGSRVWVDVTILYRIADAYAVMTGIGPGRTYEENVVKPKAIDSLRGQMGSLVAEDFYNVEKRAEASSQTRDQLAKELAGTGIAVQEVLIRQYKYLDAYEAQIREKKINDQLVFTRESEAKSETEGARKKEIDAQGKAEVEVENERGRAEVTKINATADAYARKRRAEADLLVQLAEAKGTEMLNNAYRGIGSENLVGLEMAEVLNGMDVIVIPTGGKNGMNPLDLEDTLRMFDVQ